MLNFYDFEVFNHDWLVVIINPIEKTETVIVNDPKSLEKYYDQHSQEIWIGYNSAHYDQYILKAILCGFDPKEVNDYIIVRKEPGWKFSRLFRNYPLYNFDVGMLSRSLKQLEGFMGHDIRETTVPFDIPRKLTTAEIQETIKYCKHDVGETMEVWIRSKSEFDTMMYFIRHYNYPLSYISKTKAQLAAEILGGNGKGQRFDDEFDFPILDCIHLKRYRRIAEWYKNPVNQDYEKNQHEIVAGIPHVFAWGGGHGALAKYHGTGIFLLIDVTAYYPSQQYVFHFGYRVMDHPENFEFIHESNINFKRAGNKAARQPFKILANAISGQMKQKSSKLYDPMSNNSICINGQLLLLDLIEHLEPYCQLIQNNTDGIVVKLNSYDDFEKIDDIVYEWESRTGMQMDFDQFFGDIYQKDVNNYLIVDRETGAVKAKGAYLKKLSDLDNDLPIVNKAMYEYMVNQVPVEKTINECDELIQFQKIVKISGNYLYGVKDPTFRKEVIRGVRGSKTVTVWNGDGERLTDKTFRVFASKRTRDGMICKVKSGGKNPEKFANTSDHCFIDNTNVVGREVPRYLDKTWYIDLAKKRLEQFGVRSDEK